MSVADGIYVSQEVVLGRRNTDMIIRYFGYVVQLNRPKTQVLNNAGGVNRTGAPFTFPPVRRFFGVQGREGYEQTGSVGVGTHLKHYMLGPWNDDIKQGDWFINPTDGRKFVVQYVHPDRVFETRAEIEPVQ